MTNQLTNTTTLTMSSREIAELVEVRHDNVKRTIERLEAKGLITFTPMEEPTPGGGKPVTVYHVNQRDSYVIVAQLSPEFTARLVDRWQELEAKAAKPPALPGDYLSALKALVASEEEKQRERVPFGSTQSPSLGDPVQPCTFSARSATFD